MAVKPGYWDVERCAWVGAEPTYVVPPEIAGAVPAESAAAADAVPQQRESATAPSSSALAAEG